MANSLFYRPQFTQLSQVEREQMLASITAEHSKFSLLRFESFEQYGMRTDTAIFAYGGKEFVFVPGDTVVLGWDSFIQGMDEKTSTEMKEVLSECGIDDVNTFLKESMSPVRTATISPMLVECELNEIGWRSVPVDSTELERFKKEIDKFHQQTYASSTIHKTLRLSRIDNRITADLYEPVSYNDLISKISAEGFELPTEDEWEYLCGGGSRTLFRWGDSFDFSMYLKWFGGDEPEEHPYTLQQPNQFGISIAYDPYMLELVNDYYFLKGGDGGCNLHGGMGMVVGYLPVATYFRSVNEMNDELNYKADIDGDYTFYRRIVRLNNK